MFKKLQQTIAFALSYLAISKIPIEEGKVAFSDEQTAKLTGALGEELTQKMINAMNAELSSLDALNKQALENAKTELVNLMDEAGFSAEEKEEVLNAETAEELNISERLSQFTATINEMKTTMAEQEKTIKNLLEGKAPDSGEEIRTNILDKMKYSATHAFGTGNSWDAIEGRPWNERLVSGRTSASTFSSNIDVPVLEGDLQNFIRKNPGVIESLFNDFDELPADWNEVTGVEDQFTGASVLPSEVMQGRSIGWNPKGKIKIDVEAAKVYAKKIDLEFDGQQLQKLENTWIAAVHNLDGSHPYKMSFIFWVLAELVKKGKQDERRAMINGIYAPTPDGDDIAGKALHSQNGLRWLVHYYRDVVGKIQPFQMGAPVVGSFVEYVRTMVEQIPEEERNESGWEVILSDTWFKNYKKEAGLLYELMHKTDQGKQEYQENYVIDYPQFKFRPLKDYTNTDLVLIVKSKNINKLEFKKEEKTLFTVGHYIRKTYLFADYKSGISFGRVGMKAEPGEPSDFNKQLIFCNDVPVFADNVNTTAYLTDANGVLAMNYPNVKVDDSFNQDITNLVGMYDMPYQYNLTGKVLKITGNTNIANDKKVKHNASKIILASDADFSLQSGGTLTLYAREDGKFVELSRTNAPVPPVVPTAKEFDATAIDAADGNLFKFTGTSQNVTLATILNGTEGQKVKITTLGTKTLTLSGTGISTQSAAVLAAATDYIVLVKVGDTWYEIDRDIA